MLLVYHVPNQPTAGRVYIWRKLRKLGAILLHDSIWILPATAQTREQLRWLAAEVVELKGEATVWESLLINGDEEELVAQFTGAVEPAYRKLLASVKAKNADLATLSRKYQEIRTRDYFASKDGQRVREALLAAKGDGK